MLPMARPASTNMSAASSRVRHCSLTTMMAKASDGAGEGGGRGRQGLEGDGRVEGLLATDVAAVAATEGRAPKGVRPAQVLAAGGSVRPGRVGRVQVDDAIAAIVQRLPVARMARPIPSCPTDVNDDCAGSKPMSVRPQPLSSRK